MKDTSRTLLVSTPYFPPHVGGLERYAHEIVRSLADNHGWRIVVVTSGERYGKDEKQYSNGLTVYRLGYTLKISNTPLGFSWPSKIRKILKSEEPDVVNIHMPVPGLGDIVAFFTRKEKLLLTYHAHSMRKGSLFSDLVVWLYEHLPLPLLLRRAKRIICSSEAVRSQFLRAYRHKSVVISPGVDAQTFTLPFPGERALDTILFVAADLSRACTYKGLHLLIDALQEVRRRGIAARLRVVGDGDMREVYEASVRARGLADAVRFEGRLAGERLRKAYAEAYLFVLPTANDSYPTVILEAMAAGLPVISTTVGDIPKIVEERTTGFLIAPHDKEALVEKLLMLLQDPQKAAAFGAAARRKAEKEFGWDERARRYREVLAEFAPPRPCIVQVSGYYPPHVGGVERVVRTAAESLAQRGFQTLVLTTSGTKDTRISRQENLVVKRLASFECAHTPFAPSLLWHLLTLPSRSIMHLHLAQAYWPEAVLLASVVTGIPYLVHFHLDVAPSGRLGRLFLLYKRLLWGPLLRNAEKVVICSREHEALLRERYGVAPSRIVFIPNAVGEDFFAVQSRAPSQDQFRLLFIGRLAPQKRVERLLEACALLTIPFELTIVGEGEERGTLLQLAKERKLSSIFFVGAKDDATMRNYHRRSDAFLLASDREGAPLAVLEAMAGGLPVVGSNVVGLRELLDGVGVLVDEPYPKEFARAIEALWRAPERLRELSKASVEKAKQYTWGKFTAQLEALYQTIPL